MFRPHELNTQTQLLATYFLSYQPKTIDRRVGHRPPNLYTLPHFPTLLLVDMASQASFETAGFLVPWDNRSQLFRIRVRRESLGPYGQALDIKYLVPKLRAGGKGMLAPWLGRATRRPWCVESGSEDSVGCSRYVRGALASQLPFNDSAPFVSQLERKWPRHAIQPNCDPTFMTLVAEAGCERRSGCRPLGLCRQLLVGHRTR